MELNGNLDYKITEYKIQRFINKWSCFWVTNKNRDKLDEAFEKELRDLIQNPKQS